MKIWIIDFYLGGHSVVFRYLFILVVAIFSSQGASAQWDISLKMCNRGSSSVEVVVHSDYWLASRIKGWTKLDPGHCHTFRPGQQEGTTYAFIQRHADGSITNPIFDFDDYHLGFWIWSPKTICAPLEGDFNLKAGKDDFRNTPCKQGYSAIKPSFSARGDGVDNWNLTLNIKPIEDIAEDSLILESARSTRSSTGAQGEELRKKIKLYNSAIDKFAPENGSSGPQLPQFEGLRGLKPTVLDPADPRFGSGFWASSPKALDPEDRRFDPAGPRAVVIRNNCNAMFSGKILFKSNAPLEEDPGLWYENKPDGPLNWYWEGIELLPGEQMQIGRQGSAIRIYKTVYFVGMFEYWIPPEPGRSDSPLVESHMGGTFSEWWNWGSDMIPVHKRYFTDRDYSDRKPAEINLPCPDL